MSTAAHTDTATSTGLEVRILGEGYGSGAWHGPDLKAALADVNAQVAFWRPSAERHNIAEIALHHAYHVHAARGRLSGAPVEAFVMDGEDWFALADERTIGWTEIRTLVETEQHRLTALLEDFRTGAVSSPLADAERFDLMLGITCHAVYHAGQVQLIKRLQRE
jgi:hypothetical protein